MKGLFTSVFILFSLVSQGQSTDLYPDQFGAYFLNFSLINPAYIPGKKGFDALAISKLRTGQFNKITTLSFTAGKTIISKTERSHLLRIILFNEKEGPYIERPRAYFNYALGIPFSENTSISAGASAGFGQVLFSAPSASGVGNSTMPDGAIGLTLKTKNISGGISAEQFMNARSQPLAATITLRRYYNVYMNGQKDLSPYWKLKGNALLQIFKTRKTINATLLMTYKNMFAFGSIYRNQYGLSYYFSFNARREKYNLLLSFVYNSPVLSRIPVWVNSLELAAGYNFNEF